MRTGNLETLITFISVEVQLDLLGSGELFLVLKEEGEKVASNMHCLNETVLNKSEPF